MHQNDQEHAWLLSILSVEKPSMFLASDVIKRHFGAHTETQESSSLPVARKVLGLCLAKRRLMSRFGSKYSMSSLIFYFFHGSMKKFNQLATKKTDSKFLSLA